MNQDIAAIIVREAKKAPLTPSPTFGGSIGISWLAPSVEEIANAIRLEVVEPALVLARQEASEWGGPPSAD